MPLPLISARPPSAFTSVIVQSAPSSPGPDRDEPVGADAAVPVAQRRHHDRVELGFDRIERELHQEVVAGRVQLREPEVGHDADRRPNGTGLATP